jgi:hypothetical protein
MRLPCFVILLFLAGCGVAPQPASIQIVNAYEVPLPTEEDRREFLAVLSEAAQTEGLHVDASDAGTLQHLSEVSPMTIHAAVWRGENDDESLASVMDSSDHLGRAWISFSKGQNPALSRRFRDRAMRKIMRKWPATLQLPVLPGGALPLSADLQLTPQGYRVSPAAAARYELPQNSPLVAHN